MSVLKQEAVVALDNHDHLLVVLPAEVDEGGLEVQAVADHGVEVAGVVGEDPLQQALGGRHFSLAGPLELHIQGNGQILANQMADHATVIVFGDLSTQRRTVSSRAWGI